MSVMVSNSGCSCLPSKCVRVQRMWDSDFSGWHGPGGVGGEGGGEAAGAAGRGERVRQRERDREDEMILI
jgi:hypothetical protein